jgi:hypothetical protein
LVLRLSCVMQSSHIPLNTLSSTRKFQIRRERFWCNTPILQLRPSSGSPYNFELTYLKWAIPQLIQTVTRFLSTKFIQIDNPLPSSRTNCNLPGIELPSNASQILVLKYINKYSMLESDSVRLTTRTGHTTRKLDRREDRRQTCVWAWNSLEGVQGHLPWAIPPKKGYHGFGTFRQAWRTPYLL